MSIEPIGSNSSQSNPELLRLLFLGDIIGEPGRDAVIHCLPSLKQQYQVDVVIVNGENTAAGRGITPKIAQALFKAGADIITTGDHIWDQKEIIPFLSTEPRLLRPLNWPTGVPGQGIFILDTPKGKLAAINLQGLTFMKNQLDNPFQCILNALADVQAQTPMIFIDFHAETTSEKIAMGWHLDGQVSAVIGTHTHVPTADERVLPAGTAHQTDVGMCGPLDSVIGSNIKPIVDKFLYQMPTKFGVATGKVRINGCLIQINPITGKAHHIERIHHIHVPH
jgi:hypothetical protein